MTQNNKLNFLKIKSDITNTPINEHKLFYKKHLITHIPKRLTITEELSPIIIAYQKLCGEYSLIFNKSYYKAESTASAFLTKYWGDDLIKIFNKAPDNGKSSEPLMGGNFLSTFVSVLQDQQSRTKAQILYKYNFLNFLLECLNNQGLHPNIYQRDAKKFKRFNLLITFKDNRKEYETHRILLSYNDLEFEYLVPFFNKKELIVNGTIVKYSNVKSLKITTTLLLDDEIELFGYIKGFKWDKLQQEAELFLKNCLDETNLYLKKLEEEKTEKTFKNNSITYIEQSRIDELANIKQKKFDLSKLISLCHELNQCSTMGSVIAVASLQRTIINHVPPIFDCKDFGQVLANHHTGKSVKKNLERLNNSMKNISDNHLHSQISKTEALPNMTQVDFSNDLDVLLAEVCKVLKSAS